MKHEIIDYLNDNFPGFWSDIHIRFELGGPFHNGSKRRIIQVNKRASTIFEEVFRQDDFIHVYIKDWEHFDDPMFSNNTPDYVYKLLKDKPMEVGTLFDLDEDESLASGLLERLF